MMTSTTSNSIKFQNFDPTKPTCKVVITIICKKNRGNDNGWRIYHVLDKLARSNQTEKAPKSRYIAQDEPTSFTFLLPITLTRLCMF